MVPASRSVWPSDPELRRASAQTLESLLGLELLSPQVPPSGWAACSSASLWVLESELPLGRAPGKASASRWDSASRWTVELEFALAWPLGPSSASPWVPVPLWAARWLASPCACPVEGVMAADSVVSCSARHQENQDIGRELPAHPARFAVARWCLLCGSMQMTPSQYARPHWVCCILLRERCRA